MKCIKPNPQKNLGDPIRVTNKQAATLVKSGDFVYCPKSEWKAATRPQKAGESHAKNSRN